MCGRFASDLPPELIQRVFETANAMPNLRPSWNLAPTMEAPVVRLHPQTRERRVDALRWGLVPFGTRDLAGARQPINARAETAATSPTFRAAFAARRCLVPVRAFYEWRTGPDGKQPYAIARADGELLALAGLWEGWRGPDGAVLRTFAVLTTAATGTMAALHARMPVFVEQGSWPVWLGEAAADPAALLQPAGDLLRAWPVGKAVGNVRNDAPDLLEKAACAA